MSPAVFREDVWDIKEGDEGIAFRKLKNGLTTLRFNPIITSGVFTFTAKLTGLHEDGYCYVHLGCVSKLESDSEFKTKHPGSIASRHFIGSYIHYTSDYYGPDNERVSLGLDSKLAIGDVLECTNRHGPAENQFQEEWCTSARIHDEKHDREDVSRILFLQYHSHRSR